VRTVLLYSEMLRSSVAYPVRRFVEMSCRRSVREGTRLEVKVGVGLGVLSLQFGSRDNAVASHKVSGVKCRKYNSHANRMGGGM
jgi:hypothetical protein